ncbi:hypothetical protein EWM64_g5228 [Hericium alpestre]|uniref:Uncharacterized protein n=1 Tax=Hericium alpestre TaxID=135208 RepID=A0A4Y9ZX81_9AGAM|nr:hypothetical protein EWM64_g5228 [Hericium alpestre]
MHASNEYAPTHMSSDHERHVVRGMRRAAHVHTDPSCAHPAAHILAGMRKTACI